MKTPRHLAPALAGIAALSAGCTPTLDVAVDGYAEPGTHPPGNYVIIPAGRETDAGDLRFKTFAADLEKILSDKGGRRVEDRKDAATLVRFGVTVTGPVNAVYTHDSPRYGVTGYQSVPTTATGPGGAVVMRNITVPVYGFTGYDRFATASVLYTTSVVIEGYDLAKNAGNPPQIWKTDVTATDSDSDTRSLLPLMLKVAAPHVGTNTGGMIRIRVDDTRGEPETAQ